MKINQIFIFTILVLKCSYVFATSCSRIEDKLYGSCIDGECTVAFFVKEVRSFFQCSRRPEITEAPAWASDILEFEVSKQSKKNQSGNFVLMIDRSYWSSDYPFSDKKGYIQLYEQSQIKKYYPGKLLKIDSQNIDLLRSEWRSKASASYWKMVFFQTLNIVSLIIGVLLLIRAVLWFEKWIRGTLSGLYVIYGIFIQAFILIFSFVFLSGLLTPLLSVLGIFVPGIWFYQITSILSLKYAQKKRT